MAKNELEVATEALRVIGHLLVCPNELDRAARSQRAAASARAAAAGSRSIANSTQTEDARQNAELAESLALTAEKLVAAHVFAPLN